MGYEKKMIYFLTFCINHTPISPATKTIKVHVFSAKNPTTLLKKRKIARATLTKIAGNTSTAFLASHLIASASLFNHLFKTPSFFDGEPPPSPPPPPPPKTTVIASTIVVMVIERKVSTDIVVIPCS